MCVIVVLGTGPTGTNFLASGRSDADWPRTPTPTGAKASTRHKFQGAEESSKCVNSLRKWNLPRISCVLLSKQLENVLHLCNVSPTKIKSEVLPVVPVERRV